MSRCNNNLNGIMGFLIHNRFSTLCIADVAAVYQPELGRPFSAKTQRENSEWRPLPAPDWLRISAKCARFLRYVR